MEESSQENTKFLQHEGKKERFTRISDIFQFLYAWSQQEGATIIYDSKKIQNIEFGVRKL